MLRVKTNVLCLSEGKYWHENALFSGVGYEIKDNGRVQPVEIVDGTSKANHLSQLLFASNSSDGVDISGFTEGDVEGYVLNELKSDIGLSYSLVDMRLRLHLNDRAYSGIAYEFNGKFCVGESFYQDGFIVGRAVFDVFGVLLNLSIEDELDKNYSWYPDGVLKSALLSLSDSSPDRGAFTKLMLELRFSNDECLSAVSIEGDISSLENAINSETRFPIRYLKNLENYKAAESFTFHGGAGAYKIFRLLLSQGVLLCTTAIGFPSNFLRHAECVELIVNMRELQKIKLFSMGEDEMGLAKQVKLRRPDIQVKAERVLHGKVGVYALCEIGTD